MIVMVKMHFLVCYHSVYSNSGYNTNILNQAKRASRNEDRQCDPPVRSERNVHDNGGDRGDGTHRCKDEENGNWTIARGYKSRNRT